MINFLLIEQTTYDPAVCSPASPRTHGDLYPTREQAERAVERAQGTIIAKYAAATGVKCTYTIVEVEVPDYI